MNLELERIWDSFVWNVKSDQGFVELLQLKLFSILLIEMRTFFNGFFYLIPVNVFSLCTDTRPTVNNQILIVDWFSQKIKCFPPQVNYWIDIWSPCSFQKQWFHITCMVDFSTYCFLSEKCHIVVRSWIPKCN